MEFPNISSYIQHSGKNYGLNSLVVRVDGRDIYFSYKTMIAFRGRDGKLRVVQNYWGPTTGKHLNAIEPNKKVRLTQDRFEQAWQEEVNSNDSQKEE